MAKTNQKSVLTGVVVFLITGTTSNPLHPTPSAWSVETRFGMSGHYSVYVIPMIRFRNTTAEKQAKQHLRAPVLPHLAGALFVKEFLLAAVPGFWFCVLIFGSVPGGFPGFPTSDEGGSASSSDIVAGGGLPRTTDTARMGKGKGGWFGGGAIGRTPINGQRNTLTSYFTRTFVDKRTEVVSLRERLPSVWFDQGFV